MRKYLSTTPIILACMLTSCQTWHDVSTVRTAEAETGIIVQPVVIELESVSATMITDTIDFTEHVYSDEDKPMMYSTAMVECAKKHGFDILVSPAYRMYKETKYPKDPSQYARTFYRVIISGYPAYYKKIRPATPDDSWMIPFYNRTPNIEFNSTQNSAQQTIVR